MCFTVIFSFPTQRRLRPLYVRRRLWMASGCWRQMSTRRRDLIPSCSQLKQTLLFGPGESNLGGPTATFVSRITTRQASARVTTHTPTKRESRVASHARDETGSLLKFADTGYRTRWSHLSLAGSLSSNTTPHTRTHTPPNLQPCGPLLLTLSRFSNHKMFHERARSTNVSFAVTWPLFRKTNYQRLVVYYPKKPVTSGRCWKKQSSLYKFRGNI